MKLLLLLASLLCYSNAKQLQLRSQLLRANEHAIMSAEDSAFLGAQMEKHLRAQADAKGLGVKFAWKAPTLLLEDADHGTCVKAEVKLQVGLKKQLQGKKDLVDTKSMNVDVQFGASFIDHKNQPNIVPFLIVKVTILPFAQMFETGWKAIQAVMSALKIDTAAKAISLKGMADAVKGKIAQVKTKAPALASILETFAAHTEIGSGVSDTNKGFAWTFALEDQEYKNGRPSVTFEWRPEKTGSNALTTICVKIPAEPAPYGASLGTCGGHKGINFQFGIDKVDLGAAFMGWLLPGGVADAKCKDKPADKLCSVKKIKDAVSKNVADAKKSPGLIKKFLETVGKAIMGGSMAFLAEIRFAAFLAVKVTGEIPIKNFVKGTDETGTTP